MSREVLDDVMVKGACQGKADAVVNCQCNIESAPVRCEQAENCMFYSYYKCSKQWKRLAQNTIQRVIELLLESDMDFSRSFFIYFLKEKIDETQRIAV